MQLLAPAQEAQRHGLARILEVDEVLEGEALLLSYGEGAIVGDLVPIDLEQHVAAEDQALLRARRERKHASDEHARSRAELVHLAQLLVLEALLGGTEGSLEGGVGGKGRGRPR